MGRSAAARCLLAGLGAGLALAGGGAAAQEPQAEAPPAFAEELERLAREAEPEVLRWRREIHAAPELSNREVETAARVAGELARLGLEVRTGIAGTGVVGVLKGPAKGPVVALRAEMDALPVTEETDLPFASHVRVQHEGREVGVMHACGHDAHVAILLGVARVLASSSSSRPRSGRPTARRAARGSCSRREPSTPRSRRRSSRCTPCPSIPWARSPSARAAPWRAPTACASA
jgi:amidohydrolase